MGFIVTVIIAKFVLAVTFAILLWFWQTIIGFLSFFGQLFQKYCGSAWGITLLVILGIFLGLIVAEQFQEPVWQTVDATYTVVAQPPAQLSLSFTSSGPAPMYRWMVERWNDIVYGVGDQFRVLVNDLSSLPNFDQIPFYTGIPRAFIKFVQGVSLLFFETPSWQIPFGISALASTFFRFNFCIYNLAAEFIFRILDFTLIRNDPLFCEFDPNATCILRQLPNDPPFIFRNHVENTLGFDPDTMETNCTEGVAIDCDFIACNFRAISNFSVVFSNIPGSPNLTAFYDELIPDVCCFVTRSYKAPFWLLQGLLSWCIDIGDAPDFIIDEWLRPFATCFIDFFFKLSGDTIVNIFIDIFAIIFPFIQIVIDSVVDLIACYSIFDSCYNSFPGNCEFGPASIASAGLHTCFEMSGECVVNGNEANDIDPNPLFGVVPFNFIFQTLVPFIFQTFDSGFCNFFAVRTCFFGGTSGCFFQDTVQVFCLLSCLNDVPIVRPISQPFANTLSTLFGVINTIVSGVNEFIGIINDFCDAIDNFEVGGVGLPGCHINEIEINEIESPGKRRFQKRDDGGDGGGNGPKNNKNNNSSRKKHLSNDYFNDILENTTFSSFTELLQIKHVDPNTTCGRILYEVGINYEDHNIDIYSDTDPGLYVSFWICNYLFISGMKNEKQYNGEVKMKNFLDITTTMTEFATLFDCKYKDYKAEMESFPKQNFSSNFKEDTDLVFFNRSRKTSLSNIDLNDEEALKLWSEEVRGSFVDSVRTITYGVVERILSHDISRATLDYLQLHNLITDIQLKLTGKIPGSLFNSRNRSRRRRAIGRGLSTSLAPFNYQHNYTISDIIPENDHSILQMYEGLDELERYYNQASPLEKSQIERQIQLRRDELFSVYVSYIANFFQSLYEEKRMEGVIRNEISKHNRRNRFGIKTWTTDALLQDTHKTHVITVEQLRARREVVVEKLASIDDFLDNLLEAGEYFFPDKQSIANVMKWPILNDVKYVPSIHMYLNYDFKNTEFIDNYTKYQTGELKYIIEKGFVNQDEYKLYKKQTRTTLTLITGWWTGECNITRDRAKSQNTSIFGMDYNAPSKYLKGGRSLWRLLVKEQKHKMLETRGIDLDSEEAKVFKISVGLPEGIKTIVNFVSYLVNVVLGNILKILFNVDYHFDFLQLLCNWIDSFDVPDEVDDAATNTFDFFKRLLICKIPENINGEEFYKFFCFPFLPEGVFDGWSDPVPNNPYFPLQLGIWPDELISKPCVNTFNGQSYFWRGWEISNNCGSMDGQDRPLCSTLNVDWCRRDFSTCSDIGFDSPEQSVAWFGAIVPVWLQEFYTGVIGVQGVSMFLVFLYIQIFGMGGLIFATAPWFVMPAIEGHYLILNVFDSLFQGLEGEGERGGIPYGFLYILGLAVISYLAPPTWDSMPQVIRVFFFWGLGVTWIINLVIPFRGIRTGLTLNSWFALLFKFLDRTPQFAEFVNWGGIISALEQFNYSTSSVPYVDTFCFIATLSNFMGFFFAAFLLIDVVTFFIYIGYPTLLFLVALTQAIFQFVSDIRYWQVKQRVRTIGEEFDDFRNETKKNFGKLKSDLRKNITGVFGPEFASKLINDDDGNEEEFIYSSSNNPRNRNGSTTLRKRRTIRLSDTNLDIYH